MSTMQFISDVHSLWADSLRWRSTQTGRVDEEAHASPLDWADFAEQQAR